jgi:hypothetical protein
MMSKQMKLFLLVLLTSLLFTTGCSKVTKENYGKLKMGMEYREVTALLGKPDKCEESMASKSCIWGNGTRNITVNFLGDKAMVFSCTGIK